MLLYFYICLKLEDRDFPGGAVVKNLRANAGDTGSSPGPGGFPHASEQLSPCATTTESTCLEPVLRNRRSHHSEKPSNHNKE